MNLADLSQYVGTDLVLTDTGSVQLAIGTERGRQRVLRRLLTSPGTYIFHPDYGAGLAAYVGETADVAKVQALVLGQMLLEDAVAKTPAPVISVALLPDEAGGGFSISASYVDAALSQPASLSFEVTR